MKKILSFFNETNFFYLACAITVGAIWISGFIPNSDGHYHVTNARIILDLLTGRCPAAAGIFEINPRLIPNWTTQALMAALLYLKLPMLAVDRILLSLAVLLPVLGFRAFVKSVDGDKMPCWIVLALSLNALVHVGVYNFVIGIGIGFFILAFYFRRLQAPWNARGALILALALCAMWFSHILAFFGIGLFIFICEASLILRRPFPGVRERMVETLRKNWRFYLAFVPGLILTFLYLIEPFKAYRMIIYQDWWTNIKISSGAMISLYDFFQHFGKSTFLTEGLVCGLAFSALVLVTLVRSKTQPGFKTTARQALLCAALLFVLGICAANGTKGAWLIDARLRVVAWYFVLFALCLYRPDQTVRQMMIAIAVLAWAASLYWLCSAAHHRLKLAEGIRHDLPAFSQNALIFPLSFSSDTRIMPVLYPLLDNGKCIISLENYQARLDYFPTVFRIDAGNLPNIGVPLLDRESDSYLSGIPQMHDASLRLFEKKNNLKIDYLLVWGDEQALAEKVETLEHLPLFGKYYARNKKGFSKAIREEFLPGFEQIYRFDQKGRPYLRIFRRSGTGYKE